MKTIATI